MYSAGPGAKQTEATAPATKETTETDDSKKMSSQQK